VYFVDDQVRQLAERRRNLLLLLLRLLLRRLLLLLLLLLLVMMFFLPPPPLLLLLLLEGMLEQLPQENARGDEGDGGLAWRHARVAADTVPD
jgi:hypothetical protein